MKSRNDAVMKSKSYSPNDEDFILTSDLDISHFSMNVIMHFPQLDKGLLLPIIAKTMNDLAANKDLLSFAGSSITYIRSVCLDEYDLFFSYFSSGDNQL